LFGHPQDQPLLSRLYSGPAYKIDSLLSDPMVIRVSPTGRGRSYGLLLLGTSVLTWLVAGAPV